MTRRLRKPTARWSILAGVVVLALALGAIRRSHTVAPGSLKGRPIKATVRHLSSVHMANARVGWGQNGRSLFRTTNGGAIWRRVPLGVPSHPEIIATFIGPDAAWAAASTADHTTIFRTTNAGRRWHTSKLTMGPGQMPRFIGFSNHRFGWLWASQGADLTMEAGTLWTTDNGGRTWTRVAETSRTVQAHGTIPLYGIKTGVEFSDASTGWISAQSQVTNQLWLYVTHNGGRNWSQQTLPAPTEAAANYTVYPPVLWGRRGMLAAAMSSNGPRGLVIFRTSNGGRTWQPATRAVPARVSTLSFIDGAYAIGTNGHRMFVTRDGGETWSPFPPNVSLTGVTKLQFVSPQVGFALIAGTLHSKLLKTTDGGHT